MPDTLSKTRLIGNQIVKLTTCLSTNDIAAQLSASGTANNGAVVISDEQTKGRGQRGNVWESEPGKNLMFSIVLRPDELPPQDQFRLNWVISLGIQDYLIARELTNVFIKWPNDIYINDKKVCGILIENTIKSKFIATSIIGVGLNVNQTIFESNTATSLQQELGFEYDLKVELDYLLHFIETRYETLLAGQVSKLKQDYLSKLLWVNEEHLFEKSTGVFRGEIVNVDDFGRLIVNTKSGKEMFHFKEIKYIQ